MRPRRGRSPWDLTALLNAAAGQSGLAERHLWLARLMEWLRHAPLGAGENHGGATPPPVLRLRHALNVLDKHPEHRKQVEALLVAFWRDIRTAGLFSDFGFGPRMALGSEIWDRLRLRVMPTTPDTRELAELFALLFRPDDVHWLAAIDAPTLQRLGQPS
ncbi:MAG: site-specific recombinase, partial [Rubrivivax sp.]